MTEKSSPMKIRSRASHSSESTAVAAAMARAEAESAKARLTFVDKKLQLKLEMARMEASMKRLALEEEAAAALAKAESLEAAVESNSKHHSHGLVLGPIPLDPIALDLTQRTRDCLVEQAMQREKKLLLNMTECRTSHLMSGKSIHPADITAVISPDATGAELPPHIKSDTSHHQDDSLPPAPQCSPPARNCHDENLHLTDFLRDFARRELIATTLYQFNDQPEDYRAWKCTFLNATRGLNLTYSEEMDLLVKWLGNEFVAHGERFRNVYLDDPETGLRMLWDSLEFCYGSPKPTVNALLKRVDCFPKLSDTDCTKLIELRDLLLELKAAKEGGIIPCLSFLDTFRFVNPIVKKLPSRMQKNWMSLSLGYSPYSPLKLFVAFVSQLAKKGNDPDFTFITHSDLSFKED